MAARRQPTAILPPTEGTAQMAAARSVISYEATKLFGDTSSYPLYYHNRLAAFFWRCSQLCRLLYKGRSFLPKKFFKCRKIFVVFSLTKMSQYNKLIECLCRLTLPWSSIAQRRLFADRLQATAAATAANFGKEKK